jgi:hypothetical protein
LSTLRITTPGAGRKGAVSRPFFQFACAAGEPELLMVR